MAANGSTQAGTKHPDGHWGKWRGVVCSVDGCDKPARRAGYCNGHYAQITRGKPLKPLEKRSKRNNVCSFEGCGHPENRWGLCAAHVAQKPLAIMRRIIEASSNEGDTVIEPFAGTGTACVAAAELGRHYIGIELNPEYAAIAERRIANDGLQTVEPDTQDQLRMFDDEEGD